MLKFVTNDPSAFALMLDDNVPISTDASGRDPKVDKSIVNDPRRKFKSQSIESEDSIDSAFVDSKAIDSNSFISAVVRVIGGSSSKD
mmetsp:Transcript_20142/g.22822  ORF Transcript_20142/g.22822 Transcript_20142/m.22822 type:complete len:87 (-) Transcript_20142:519-779(-)